MTEPERGASQVDDGTATFTAEDVLRLQRLAASFEFRARTTADLERSRAAERTAHQLRALANKVAQALG